MSYKLAPAGGIPILNKTTMRTIRKKASIIELEYTPKFG